VKKNIGVLEFSMPEGLLAEIDLLVAPVKNRMWFEGMPENNIPRKNP
jgi:L-galactose dehydrogenase